ncbi:MAG: SDR family oxidoreductase [Chloroflexota bacterium]|nr:SDR family oxidoreductase [Chloroflexota bacterium]
MQQRILVTGGTGMIGRGLVGCILRSSDAEVYVLLHRAGVGRTPEDLLSRVFGVEADPRYRSRLHLLTGDMTKPSLDLPPAVQDRLGRELTHILHSAATTRFDLPLEEARRSNVGGTAHVLELARRCRQLHALGFISTAYVAGRRTGTVLESEREHDAGFANTYERSKYEAESLVEAAGESFPASIYRLSTILGDSRTGIVSHFTAPHHALRMMYLGLVSILPGEPDFTVDLVPSDFASSTVFRLFLKAFEPGQRLHITAPPDKSYTLREMLETSYSYLGAADADWARRGYPLPSIASLDTFELFVRSAEQANNPVMQGVMRALSQFAPQLAYPKQFDRSELLRLLPGYDAEVPDVRDYYGKVVQFCVRTKWGRNV